MKPRLMLVFLVAFSLALACRKSTPPTVPVRDADADVPVVPVLVADASTGQDAGNDASTTPPRRTMRRGVNISGAEFGKVLGVHGVDYTWDKTDAAADFFFARGMTTFRIPMRHERLQRVLMGPLDETEWARLKGRVDHITALGATVLLVPQNSYRHGVKGCTSSAKADPNCKIVSEVEIADFFGRVASRLKDNPRVQLESTNEPHDQSTEDVAKLGAAVLKEIRRVGFNGAVILAGGGWGGASHWDEDFDGTTRSSIAMLAVPIDGEVVFDSHVYLDKVGDGTGECVSPVVGEQRMTAFVAWLHKNGRRGVIGEIAAINTERCRVAMTNALTFIEANGDVLDGWLWYGAGAWSYAGIYPLSIGPTLPGQPEKVQLGWLTPFLSPARAGESDAGH